MAAEPVTYELPERVRVEDCARMVAFLQDVEGQPVDMHCGQVVRLHGLAVQAIAMALKAWGTAGVPLHIVAPTDAFNAAFATLGLTDILPQESDAA